MNKSEDKESEVSVEIDFTAMVAGAGISSKDKDEITGKIDDLQK